MTFNIWVYISNNVTLNLSNEKNMFSLQSLFLTDKNLLIAKNQVKLKLKKKDKILVLST